MAQNDVEYNCSVAKCRCTMSARLLCRTKSFKAHQRMYFAIKNQLSTPGRCRIPNGHYTRPKLIHYFYELVASPPPLFSLSLSIQKNNNFWMFVQLSCQRAQQMSHVSFASIFGTRVQSLIEFTINAIDAASALYPSNEFHWNCSVSLLWIVECDDHQIPEPPPVRTTQRTSHSFPFTAITTVFLVNHSDVYFGIQKKRMFWALQVNGRSFLFHSNIASADGMGKFTCKPMTIEMFVVRAYAQQTQFRSNKNGIWLIYSPIFFLVFFCLLLFECAFFVRTKVVWVCGVVLFVTAILMSVGKRQSWRNCNEM